MGFFLGLLKLLFGKREPWTPLFMLSDCEDDEGPQLRFDCEGDYTGECCEILDRLCAGRFAAIWMEDLFWMEQRQEKRTREIVYHTTFPMYYAQEIAGTDDLLRMRGDWKELISVSRGFDRKLFAAFLEKRCLDFIEADEEHLPEETKRFWKLRMSIAATTGCTYSMKRRRHAGRCARRRRCGRFRAGLRRSIRPTTAR